MSKPCRGTRHAVCRSEKASPSDKERRWPFWLRPWIFTSTLLSAVLALLWLIVRTGTKPSRVAYPCQQAALATAVAAFGPHLVAAFLAVHLRTLTALRATSAKSAKLLFVALTVVCALLFGARAMRREAAIEILAPPASYHPEIYLVNDARGVEAGRHGGVDDLIGLMGRSGFKWHRSTIVTLTSGPDGLIDRDDVVLVKINGQWTQRGGTNTDVLRGVIRQVVEHPDGFVGELVVADNGQGRGELDPDEGNAEDRQQSSLDVVKEFQAEGWNISAMLWDGLRHSAVDEFSADDMRSGYVVSSAMNTETQIRVSYPKFETPSGTYISYRQGVWSQLSETYDPGKLVVINLPVFKTHFIYAITASVKNHMGVITQALGTDSHDAVARGGMGSVLAEVRMPDINILDCIWILARPGSGPSASYSQATRRDQLVASTDPVALDAWATKFIMIPQIIENGYTTGDYQSTQDPDNSDSVFRRYLDQSMNELLRAGVEVTNDYGAVRLQVWSGEEAPDFVRGDGNIDGTFDISDAITVLIAHFLGSARILCEDGADSNDDGKINVADALYSLNYLFRHGPRPPPPFPDPGEDPTLDELADC